ncbi:MAG: hypothetical protein LDLANPLL_01676 [Turneriella sp.]|nr:hypothetical protein [Turneriella sp.]
MRRYLALGLAGFLAILFTGLAVWQLKRYAQNSALVRQKQHFTNQKPETISSFVGVDFSQLRFHRITIAAEIYRGAWVLLPGKSASGESGRHFYVFARPENGDAYIPVLAGFAGAKTNPEAYWKTIPAKMQITGTVSEMYPARDASLIRAGNPTEFVIPVMETSAFKAMTGLKIFSGVLESEAQLSNDLEKVAQRIIIKPEMNLVYTLQWLALAALCVWWLKTQIYSKRATQ